MNIRNRVSAIRRALVSTFVAGLCAGSLSGQVDQNPTEEKTSDDTIVLSPFLVTGKQVGRYQSTDATSGGRVRIDVFDASQSISVITRDLMNDISSSRVLDAAKYVSGITESILPGGLDRTTIRGFQVDGTTVDGFNAGSQQGNLDPVLIERVEVIKGPNAVLSPSGVPGGTINLVSRKPQFNNFGSISYQVGIYNGNRAELDINRVFGANKNWAFRVVGAYYDTELYPHVPIQNTTWMPMFTWKSKSGAQFTAQFEYFDFWDQNYLGYPIDPSSSSTNYAKRLAGLPRDLNTSDNDFRTDRRKEFRTLLTAPLSDSINMRLATRFVDLNTNFSQNIPGLVLGTQTGGAVNPLTGLYTPGFVYGPGPTYTPSPAAPMLLVLARNGNEPRTTGPTFNLQNDYVHEYKSNFVDATTLAGVAYNYSKQNVVTTNDSRPSINYAAPVSGLPYVRTTLNAHTVNTVTSEQLYISETFKLWNGKIALNGSYAYNNFDLALRNLVTVAPTTAVPVPQQKYNGAIDTSLISYGIVAKPIPSVAIYYSHSEVASVNVPGATGATGYASGNPNLTLQAGIQEEYGIRFEGLKKRLFVTLSHFDITQDNFSVPNPGNLVVPQPVPLLPALIANRLAKGWEFELRANLTKQLSIVGNYTKFTNRDGNGMPFRGTAEESWAALASYQFKKQSALSGLSLSLGADHLGPRPGDAPGATPNTIIPTGGTPYTVPIQPTFWLAPRTVVNLAAIYELNKNWSCQLNIDNLLDEDYIAASVNRSNVMPGSPLDARFKVKYSF